MSQDVETNWKSYEANFALFRAMDTYNNAVNTNVDYPTVSALYSAMRTAQDYRKSLGGVYPVFLFSDEVETIVRVLTDLMNNADKNGVDTTRAKTILYWLSGELPDK